MSEERGLGLASYHLPSPLPQQPRRLHTSACEHEKSEDFGLG